MAFETILLAGGDWDGMKPSAPEGVPTFTRPAKNKTSAFAEGDIAEHGATVPNAEGQIVYTRREMSFDVLNKGVVIGQATRVFYSPSDWSDEQARKHYADRWFDNQL